MTAAKNKPPVWHSLAIKKPAKYDLVTFRDGHGKEQPGWWDGWYFCFGEKRIGDPVDFRTGPIDILPARRDDSSSVKVYSICTDGKTSVRKTR